MRRFAILTFLPVVFGLWTNPAADQSRIAIADSTLQALEGQITAPPGFAVSVFAAPPQVHYPTCITAALTGELFVGADKNSSLSAERGRGKVLRLVDEDEDGRADAYTPLRR